MKVEVENPWLATAVPLAFLSIWVVASPFLERYLQFLFGSSRRQRPYVPHVRFKSPLWNACVIFLGVTALGFVLAGLL